MRSFSAQVSERTSTYRRRIEATFKSSAQDIAEEVTTPVSQGGKMRVDTGFLRSSLLGSTSAMPLIDRSARPAEGQSYSPTDADIELVILGAQLGQTIFLGFTASYAGIREVKDRFVLSAAQNWQNTVDRNAARAVAAFR